MKYLAFLLLISISISVYVYAQTIRLSEPTVTDAISETFGAVLDADTEEVSIADLALNSELYLGKKFTVKTPISKVCQKKGCFFIAQQNEHIIRVSFKDYGFFIPTDSGGKTVTLMGELIQKQMSKKQADHFAADLQTTAGDKKSSVIKPGAVYEIVACSVKIPLS